MAPIYTGSKFGFGRGAAGAAGPSAPPGYNPNPVSVTAGGDTKTIGPTYSSFPYGNGASAVVSPTAEGRYLTFKIEGVANSSEGGVTTGVVFMEAGQSVYIRHIGGGAGGGRYIGLVNDLEPSTDRPGTTLLVAGGSGAQSHNHPAGVPGGKGGGSTGQPGGGGFEVGAGSQNAGGTAPPNGGQPGQVWYGGNDQDGGTVHSGAGGGGWYGGAGGGPDSGSGGWGSGGGGSGYVSSTLVNASGVPQTHGYLAPSHPENATSNGGGEGNLHIKIAAEP